jgi:hypothetical protein
MGATGARGELGRPGRGLTKSGNVADDGWPMGGGGCICLRIFLMVEHRDRIAGEDHRHRQRNCNAKAAFIFLCFGFGAHFGLPFVRFAGVLPACQYLCRERANFSFLRKLANSLYCWHICASNYCQQVVNYANV